WPLEHRLRFAGVSAALAVHEFGGSLAAPGWGDIGDWWRRIRACAAEGNPESVELAGRYGFLDELVPRTHVCGVRRAAATIARPSYAGLPLVMLRLDEVEVSRLEELVRDAWRMRAPPFLVTEPSG